MKIAQAALVALSTLSYVDSQSLRAKETPFSTLTTVDSQSLRNKDMPLPNLSDSLIVKLETPVDQLSVEDRAGLVEQLAESLQDNLGELNELDLTNFPHAEELIESTGRTVEGIYKSISDVIYDIRSSGGLLDGVDEEDDSSRPQDYSESQGQYGNENDTNRRRRTFENGGHSRFRNHFESPRHEHMNKLHEALWNGDHKFVDEMLSSFDAKMNQYSGGMYDEHGRRMQAVTKEKQCQRLVKCASGMSLYDLFVYYYSDDIDPSTGEVDSSISHFDEGSILDKQERIQNYVSRIGNDGLSNLCEDLLQEFHRNIEVDGIPEWGGATVTQVCLAEGTQVFVKLEDVIKTLLDNLPELDATEIFQKSGQISGITVGEERLLEYRRITDAITLEPLACAEELYYNRVDDEHTADFFGPFVFQEGNNRPNGERPDLYVIPIEIDPNARDSHGQLKRTGSGAGFGENNNPFTTDDFLFNRGNDDKTEFQTCLDSKTIRNFADQIRANRECFPVRGRQLRRSLELVFGEKPSTGHICGIKEGKDTPGTCCLDAPYQLQGDDWGFAYECSMRCQNSGPLFSWMSPEACSVHGGTFCPIANCRDLLTCVEEQLAEAEENDLPAFAEYLRAAPAITDPTDAWECGRTREYFGFQDTFTNDDAICEDIHQLQFTRDFDILNSLFDQGNDGDVGESDNDGPSGSTSGVPALVLNEPAPVTVRNGQPTRASLFAIEQALSIVEFFLDTTDGIECPCDPLCIIENICKAVQNVLHTKIGTVVFALQKIRDVGEFTYGERLEVGNLEPFETLENTKAVFDNMVETGKYLQDRFEDVNTRFKELSDDLDLVRSDVNKDALTVEVEVVSYKKDGQSSLIILSQFRGALVNGAIELEGFDEERKQMVAINFSQVSLGVGKTLIEFHSGNAKFFFVKFTESSFDVERSILINSPSTTPIDTPPSAFDSFKKIGDGFCADSNTKDYDYVLLGGFSGVNEDCAAECVDLQTDFLVGFSVISHETCFCFYDNNRGGTELPNVEQGSSVNDFATGTGIVTSATPSAPGMECYGFLRLGI